MFCLLSFRVTLYKSYTDAVVQKVSCISHDMSTGNMSKMQHFRFHFSMSHMPPHYTHLIDTVRYYDDYDAPYHFLSDPGKPGVRSLGPDVTNKQTEVVQT